MNKSKRVNGLKSIRGILTVTFLFIFLIFSYSNGKINQNMNSASWGKTVETPVLDGVISSDEYSDSTSFNAGNFMVYWLIEGDTIYLGLTGNTDGWITIGIEPKESMKDADMIFGWVYENGTVGILDCYSTGKYGPHPPDTDLGGTYDVLAYNGSEDSGNTIIEFSRKLITGDQYDNEISTTGKVTIIWAVGPSDNYLDKHSSKGSGTMTMSIDTTTNEDEKSTPGFHFITVILAAIGLMVKHQRFRKS
jgi:hypothetical protein